MTTQNYENKGCLIVDCWFVWWQSGKTARINLSMTILFLISLSVFQTTNSLKIVVSYRKTTSILPCILGAENVATLFAYLPVK